MAAFIDRSGKRFGRLLAIKPVGYSQTNRIWECRCDCGNTVQVSGVSLGNGHTKSCGCLQREHKQHGHSPKSGKSPTYVSWDAMLQRCSNKNHEKYIRYGERGVRVCRRWRKFENFLADMGERPKGKTLDRFPDPSGNYKPGNCRWATPKQQAANHRKKAA